MNQLNHFLTTYLLATFKSGDVRTKNSTREPTPGPSTEAMQPPIRRTTAGMLAKKRAQVDSDRAKARSFRDERVPLLARLGEVDNLVRKYDWSVESGAVEVVEMLEQMAKEKAEDRRRQIAVEARGKQPYRAIASPDVAGPSRARPASPRGNAPRATSNHTGKYVGTIPKYRDKATVAQEERERHRAACGYRGGSMARSRSQSRRGGQRARGGPHQHHNSAGQRDANGDRVVSHPPQDRGNRAGAGQSARHSGHRSTVDSHGRSFGADSTDWSEDQWDEEEGGEAE